MIENEKMNLHFRSLIHQENIQYYLDLVHSDLPQEIQLTYPTLEDFESIFDDSEFFWADMKEGKLILKTYFLAKNKKVEREHVMPLKKIEYFTE